MSLSTNRRMVGSSAAKPVAQAGFSGDEHDTENDQNKTFQRTDEA